MNERLPAGAYESLHTRALDRALGAVPHATPRFGEVESTEAPEVLVRHVADVVRRALQEQPHHQRLEKITELLAQGTEDADVVVALAQLLALTLREAPGVHRLVVRPATPLSDVALLTNTPPVTGLARRRSSFARGLPAALGQRGSRRAHCR